MCCWGHGELVWHFLEPDTGLDHCPRILLSCFRARISDEGHDEVGSDSGSRPGVVEMSGQMC